AEPAIERAACDLGVTDERDDELRIWLSLRGRPLDEVRARAIRARLGAHAGEREARAAMPTRKRRHRAHPSARTGYSHGNAVLITRTSSIAPSKNPPVGVQSWFRPSQGGYMPCILPAGSA